MPSRPATRPSTGVRFAGDCRTGPVQGPAVPGGQVEAAEGDEAAVGLGDMDAAAAEPFEIQVPGVLKGHGRDGKGVAAGPAEKLLEIIARFGIGCYRGSPAPPPLPGGDADGGQRPFLGGFGRAVAGGAAEALQPAVFLHQVFGRKRAEGMFAARRPEIVEL